MKSFLILILCLSALTASAAKIACQSMYTGDLMSADGNSYYIGVPIPESLKIENVVEGVTEYTIQHKSRIATYEVNIDLDSTINGSIYILEEGTENMTMLNDGSFSNGRLELNLQLQGRPEYDYYFIFWPDQPVPLFVHEVKVVCTFF